MNLRNRISNLFVSKPNINRKDLLVSLLIMAWVVEARDPYTGGHLWRVSRFAHRLALELGMSETEAARIAIGGFLHDLGKVGIPDQILTHPEIGWRMLASHPLAHIAENAIRFHHETPDGKGYPTGISGTEIPIDARIVGICDAFDAMTSTRPYRTGMPIEKALSIIESELGRQFDSIIGAKFVALGKDGHWKHIVGHTDQGIPLQVCGMCGPTVVLRKEQRSGEHVYCRSCATEFVTEQHNGTLGISPTGRNGRARDLEPLADLNLIERLLQQSSF
jgi:hypothetical protein